MENSFEDFLTEFNRQLSDLKEQDKPHANTLFTREILRKLAGLSPEQYQRFKDNLSIELHFSGVNLQEIPAEAKLDRMVTAMRSQIEHESFDVPRRLGDMLPDAMHPDILVPNCWHISDEGIVQTSGDDDAGTTICDCPLYVAARIRDSERGEESLVIVVKVDREWRKVYVPASASSNAICKAVAGTGAIVSDRKALDSYIMDIRKINKGQIPIETQESTESIFDRWVDYVASHESEFVNGKWGRVALIDRKKHLIVFPERVEQFLKKQSARLRPVLVAWKSKDLIYSESGLLYATKIGSRHKRMVAFPLDMLGVELAVLVVGKESNAKEKQDVA